MQKNEGVKEAENMGDMQNVISLVMSSRQM
jgi:hypothetical protein